MNFSNVTVEVEKILREAVEEVKANTNPIHLKNWEDLKDELTDVKRRSEQGKKMWKEGNFSVLQIEEEGFRRGIDYALHFMSELEKWSEDAE